MLHSRAAKVSNSSKRCSRRGPGLKKLTTRVERSFEGAHRCCRCRAGPASRSPWCKRRRTVYLPEPGTPPHCIPRASPQRSRAWHLR
ncbi:hypothetical protein M885DRAFT_256895 [Pelagophyceae sp. CCMP2097]|nr:hypothetical protein M885DRAFT_256895 [Pelagophyceae sp. CCMP2097]